MGHYIDTLIYSRPWAILPDKLADIDRAVALWAAGAGPEVTEWGAQAAPAVTRANRVAVIPVFGTISQRANLVTHASGGVSTDQLRSQYRDALASRDIGTIVLDVDSPGGAVQGVPELAQEIYRARGQKRTIAVANSLMASAAYWLGSAADEIVMTPSGEVGSIGVVAVHREQSQAETASGLTTTIIKAGKYKAEANASEPLAPSARAHLQSMVDTFYQLFVHAVAKHRGVSVADVRGGFGEGRTVVAGEALGLGMVDRVDTLPEVLEKLGAAVPTRSLSKKSVRTRVRLARARRENGGRQDG